MLKKIILALAFGALGSQIWEILVCRSITVVVEAIAAFRGLVARLCTALDIGGFCRAHIRACIFAFPNPHRAFQTEPGKSLVGTTIAIVVQIIAKLRRWFACSGCTFCVVLLGTTHPLTNI